jgi:hypothetical protein
MSKDASGVVRAESLAGVRFWAEHHPERTPRFTVYRYVGMHPERELFFFEPLKEGVIFSVHYLDLHPRFRPFLMDTKRIEALLNGDQEVTYADL